MKQTAAMCLIGISIVLCLLESPAAGQATQPESGATQPSASTPGARHFLAGPQVNEEATRVVVRYTTDGRETAPPAVRPPQWFQAVQKLALDPQQRAEVQSIIREYQQASRAYRLEYREEYQQVERVLREARERGQEPPGDARLQLRKLMEGAPQPLAYQRRIWDMLNDEQQQSLRVAIAELRKRSAERDTADTEAGS